MLNYKQIRSWIFFCDEEESMTESNSQRLVILMISIGLSLVLLVKASEISGGELTQPAAILTPRAFLPVIAKSAPFVKTENSPFYLQNFANNAGCNWLGMAGEVLNLEHTPVAAGSYVVHIWGSGINTRVIVGTAPAYSPSGWELFLFDSPVVRDYEIQLELPNDTAVSPIYAVQTRASCNENLVRFDFIESG
jgi:hypothetical protein